MGMFKQMKQMKAMVAEAPAMIANANELASSVQAMGQQSAFAMLQAPTVESTAATAVGPDFEPVAGVTIEAYAEVCRDLAAVGYDQSQATVLAGRRGIDAASWEAAAAGWQARMQQNLAVGQRFNALFMQRH